MEEWEKKAHRIIGALCRASYEQANRLPDGSLRKKHRPYARPEVAQRLVECLGKRDEETAKSIFLFDYEASKVV